MLDLLLGLAFHVSIPFLWRRSESYNIFEHNCNTFSNEVAQFLTGRKIPSYITDLPSEVLATWVCILLLPVVYCFMIMLEYLTEAAVPVSAGSVRTSMRLRRGCYLLSFNAYNTVRQVLTGTGITEKAWKKVVLLSLTYISCFVRASLMWPDTWKDFLEVMQVCLFFGSCLVLSLFLSWETSISQRSLLIL